MLIFQRGGGFLKGNRESFEPCNINLSNLLAPKISSSDNLSLHLYTAQMAPQGGQTVPTSAGKSNWEAKRGADLRRQQFHPRHLVCCPAKGQKVRRPPPHLLRTPYWASTLCPRPTHSQVPGQGSRLHSSVRKRRTGTVIHKERSGKRRSILGPQDLRSPANTLFS